MAVPVELGDWPARTQVQQRGASACCRSRQEWLQHRCCCACGL